MTNQDKHNRDTFQVTITMSSDYALTQRERIEIEDYLSDKGFENVEVSQAEKEA